MTALQYIEDIDKDGEEWSNDTSKIADAMEAYAKYYHKRQVKKDLIAGVGETCGHRWVFKPYLLDSFCNKCKVWKSKL